MSISAAPVAKMLQEFFLTFWQYFSITHLCNQLLYCTKLARIILQPSVRLNHVYTAFTTLSSYLLAYHTALDHMIIMISRCASAFGHNFCFIWSVEILQQFHSGNLNVMHFVLFQHAHTQLLVCETDCEKPNRTEKSLHYGDAWCFLNECVFFCSDRSTTYYMYRVCFFFFFFRGNWVCMGVWFCFASSSVVFACKMQ